jgi:hypothetical protein
MENLDELMRKKFDSDQPSERFEFREEYWEQAQAMLEAEEARRKKRRRWLLWWLFFGAVVTAGVITVGRSSWQEQFGSGTRQEQGAGSNSSSSGSQQQQGAELNGDDVQTQGGGVESSFVLGEKTYGADSVFLKNKIDNQYFNTKNNAAKKGVSGETRPGSLPSGKSKKPTILPPLNSKTDSPEGKQPAHNNAQAESAAPNISPELTTAAAQSNNDSNDLNALNDAPSIPTLLSLLDIPARDLDTPFAETKLREIKPLRDRLFRFGLYGAASLYQPSPDGKRFGWAGGIFGEYNFSPKWSLSLGARWRMVPGYRAGDTVSVEERTQLRYGFGFERDEQTLEQRGLDFLEVPLAVRRRFGVLSVEGGVATGLLLGARAQLAERHSESLQADPTVTRSNVWGDKSPYRSMYFSPFLGAEWQVTKHLGLSVGGHYRPGSLLKPSDTEAPGSLLWLDAGLRWRF